MTDAEYVEARNRLIPEAEKAAKKRLEKHLDDGGKVFWSDRLPDGKTYAFFYEALFFHQEMNRLAYENRLVRFR